MPPRAETAAYPGRDSTAAWIAGILVVFGSLAVMEYRKA
jgi:hypothetical protein